MWVELVGLWSGSCKVLFTGRGAIPCSLLKRYPGLASLFSGPPAARTWSSHLTPDSDSTTRHFHPHTPVTYPIQRRNQKPRSSLELHSGVSILFQDRYVYRTLFYFYYSFFSSSTCCFDVDSAASRSMAYLYPAARMSWSSQLCIPAVKVQLRSPVALPSTLTSATPTAASQAQAPDVSLELGA